VLLNTRVVLSPHSKVLVHNRGGVDSSSGDGVVVYRGRAKPMLVSLSDLYFNKEISISDSRLSSCSTYIFY